MLPDDPFDQARFFYLAILLVAVVAWAMHHYRDRMGQAVQHAAIWVLIFMGVMLGVVFFEPLKHALTGGDAQLVDDRTVLLRQSGDGHFYATVEVNGKDVEFMVDTGASEIVLTRADARKVGIDVGGLAFTVPSGTANGVVMSAPVRLDRMTLGGFTDADVRALVNGGEMHQSLLGMSYLKRFSSFRSEGGRLYLTR